jgi:hypothetical protein
LVFVRGINLQYDNYTEALSASGKLGKKDNTDAKVDLGGDSRQNNTAWEAGDIEISD